jgi:hypothetical protein
MVSPMDEDTRQWLPRGYNPARFEPAAVRFDDPAPPGVLLVRRC